MGLTATFQRLSAPCCALAVISGCSPQHLPPRAAPGRGPVSVSEPPTAPTDSEGTVTLDVTEGSAEVRRILAAPMLRVDHYHLRVTDDTEDADPTSISAGSRTFYAPSLCHTPCTVNLPRGHHRLAFVRPHDNTTQVSLTYIQVGERPAVLRHAMGGRNVSPHRHLLGITLIAGFALSIASLSVGTVAVLADEDSRLNSTSLGFLSVGAVLGLGSWAMAYLFRPRIQDGASTQWTP
mgnify:CR=1 FL=1